MEIEKLGVSVEEELKLRPEKSGDISVWKAKGKSLYIAY